MAPAEELMNTGITLRIPLEVEYEYKGSRTVDTNDGIKTLHSIIANYRINYEVKSTSLDSVPQKLFGFATAKYLWDEVEGIPWFSAEEYNLIVVYPGGKTQEFDIRSKTFYKKVKKLTTKKKDSVSDAIAKAFNTGEGPRPMVKKHRRGLSIEIPDILFDFNSSELKSDSEEILEKVIAVLDEQQISRLEVIGHTDSTGSDSYNMNLSKNRAKSVAKFLLEESKRLKNDRVAYKGLGSTRPAYSNNTAKGRQMNRRVEILVLEK